MNTSLVKRLAHEAGWVRIAPDSFADQLQDIYNQNLVRAVVQECASQAAQMRHVYPHQAELTATTLLEHFGVESRCNRSSLRKNADGT
jgi:type II secretory ATPase GspE/PulE/Tfp pilus assembly ATPase PilB-like protein